MIHLLDQTLLERAPGLADDSPLTPTAIRFGDGPTIERSPFTDILAKTPGAAPAAYRMTDELFEANRDFLARAHAELARCGEAGERAGADKLRAQPKQVRRVAGRSYERTSARGHTRYRPGTDPLSVHP